MEIWFGENKFLAQSKGYWFSDTESYMEDMFVRVYVYLWPSIRPKPFVGFSWNV